MDCGSPSWKIKQIKYQVRSISLPARSHPSTQKIEEELTRLHSCLASKNSSSSVSSLVAQLGEVYISLEDLLRMPSTHQLLISHHHHNYMADQVLEGSMEMLDVCGILRDTVLPMKEQLQALQSALRRRPTTDEAAVLEYNRFRKKIRKESIVKVVSSLKQMGNNLVLPCIEQDDHHLVAVIRVLREVNVLSISAFQSLSSFLSSSSSEPTRPTTTTRWLSRLVGMENSNEVESLDASLHPITSSNNHRTTVQKQLEELETTIGDIEEALNHLFRRMIKSRASLLNLISH